MGKTEYIVSLQTSVVTIQVFDFMVNRGELIGTTQYLTVGEGSYKPMSL